MKIESKGRGAFSIYDDDDEPTSKKKSWIKRFIAKHELWWLWLIIGTMVVGWIVAIIVALASGSDMNTSKKVSEMTVEELYCFGFFMAMMIGVFSRK